MEATSVLRNVVNHAYALRWLVDNDPLAVDALIAKDHEGAEKIHRNLEQVDWPAAVLAAPMLATEDAQALFDADLATWPLHRARLQLAYGIWLPRRQQAGDSRAPSRTARDTFDAIGADAWAERARRELCAAGERSDQRSPKALDVLAPQELQIARLAAEGLRKPGDRLAALPIAPNRPQPPIPDLPKARRHVATEPAAVVGATLGPV